MPSPDNRAVSTEPDTLAAVETETAPLQLLHLDERLA
ncbi:MAG: pseudouridylate synthase, partial [Stenotrophomonas sp.]